MIARSVPFSGNLQVAVRRVPCAPLSWTIRNRVRPAFWWGWLCVQLAHLFSRIIHIATLTSQLSLRVRRASGEWIDYGVVGYRVVTTAGVGFLVDAWQNSVEMEIMKYHGCGTGVGAEAVGDTALGTECTSALNPDNTRATGSLAEGASANIFSTVGTLTFDAGAAVTEHGILSQAATGGGVLWDRTLFSAVNVASGDSIQFTYQCTCTAGG